MKHTILIYLGIALLLTSSCASKKQGQWLMKHSELLKKAARSETMSKEQKLDILAGSFTKMMHQSLNFANPKKGVLYAKTYSEQNKDNIDIILKDIGQWREDMNILEVAAFALKLSKKDYIKDFIDLYPRFQRKFKTYSTIIGLSSKVGKGIIGLGGKQLEGLGL